MHLTKLICLAKPQNKNLFLPVFPPKNKNKNPTPHRTQDLLKNTFSKLRKISMWQMAHMPLWCDPLGAGGSAEMSQQLRGAGGTCVDSRSMQAGLHGRAVG